jgi:hypothetical protein
VPTSCGRTLAGPTPRGRFCGVVRSECAKSSGHDALVSVTKAGARCCGCGGMTECRIAWIGAVSASLLLLTDARAARPPIASRGAPARRPTRQSALAGAAQALPRGAALPAGRRARGRAARVHCRWSSAAGVQVPRARRPRFARSGRRPKGASAEAHGATTRPRPRVGARRSTQRPLHPRRARRHRGTDRPRRRDHRRRTRTRSASVADMGGATTGSAERLGAAPNRTLATSCGSAQVLPQ